MAMRPALLPLAAAFALAAATTAQGPPANGPAPADPGFHALVGGDVVVRPGQRIERATLVLRRGRVVSVAAGAEPPAGAHVHDCSGLTLYPGLIEPCLTVDAPAPDPDAPTVHWHPAVLPQRSALDGDGATAKDREELRALGFAAAAIAPTGGVFKGTAAVVLLQEPEAGERAPVLRASCYALCSMQRSRGTGPNSEMGAIALLRQGLADADWYERCQATAERLPALRTGLPAESAALRALAAQRRLPLAFDLEDELQALRAARIASEFERSALLLGSGMEFRRLEAIAATGLPVVVPVHFPEAPDVTTLARAERVSLRQLQSWEQAPTNLARLLAAGVRTAVTSARLPARKDFRERLAEAMACGVTAEQALAALTTVPADLLGVAADLGTLEVGRVANVVAVAGDLFDPKAEIRDVWVGGRRHEITAAKGERLEGIWSAVLAQAEPLACQLVVTRGKVTVRFGEREAKARAVHADRTRLEFLLADEALGTGSHWCRLRLQDGRLAGSLWAPDGSRAELTATREGDAPPPEPQVAGGEGEEPGPGRTEEGRPATPLPPPPLDPLPVPLGGYGSRERPEPQDAVFTGATLWTCGPAGKVLLGSLYVRDGKIAHAGPREELPPVPEGTPVIDCTGKHITPGLIDCHSHTGISRGVNESGEAVTAEVRIADVIDPDDVNWYRQLAGGVTAVNQLHGSANVIGGQSSTVKVRWGVGHPDGMAMAGRVPGIKWALGENPRRANRSGDNDRYPNTRMGVEALLRDRLLAAADYRRRVQEYEAMAPRERAQVLPPRRDLELEALAEVLAGRRRVHCHSYRQDEIFMLCGIAREFSFRIGTFQHALEGYKVAEAIAAAAHGASSFSDWWAYKFEVYDAIPENGAIMHEAGVCVSFNSDSDEHARRLNTEAGKAVRYGGLEPVAALRFVTLNPAIQLGIQDRTGSLERGKDADFAIWSDDPLSYASLCEATWVDGTPMFTLERDRELRAAAAAERQRLLQRALLAGKARGKTAREDASDAYWAAEDLTAPWCCRDCEGGAR